MSDKSNHTSKARRVLPAVVFIAFAGSVFAVSVIACAPAHREGAIDKAIGKEPSPIERCTINWSFVLQCETRRLRSL